MDAASAASWFAIAWALGEVARLAVETRGDAREVFAELPQRGSGSGSVAVGLSELRAETGGEVECGIDEAVVLGW